MNYEILRLGSKMTRTMLYYFVAIFRYFAVAPTLEVHSFSPIYSVLTSL